MRPSPRPLGSSRRVERELGGSLQERGRCGDASVAAATGSRFAPYTLLRLRALQGREAEASAAIEQAAAGGPSAALYARWAAAVLYNGLARYKEAAWSARQATSNTFEYWVSVWALPELVEAAMHVGDAELARDALERLAETTQPAGTDFALGIETRSRALLSDGTAANDLYREAIERLSRTRLRPELARAHLLYGEWLRREGRRVDARGQLRTAHHLFDAIGMEAFAERARRKLLATGEKARSAAPARAGSSRLRRSRSPGSPATACRTQRSAPSCSSARARSSGTCATCSPSSASPRAGSSKRRCPRTAGSPAPVLAGVRSAGYECRG